MTTADGRPGTSSSLTKASGAADRASPVPPGDETEERFPRRLDVILRALPESELSSLVRRMTIKIDAGKRIDTPSQVARALVGSPDIRDTSRLTASSRELLHRIAEAGGALLVPSLPAGLEPLIHRGIVFGRKVERGVELVLPTAFLLQLKGWEGEHPRALRALLAQAPFETMSAVASHYLGRPATPPISLSLEAAWEVVSDPAKLVDEIEKLAPVERKLLESIEAVGGEVDTQELLDLEREPMRLRGVGGVTSTRRGAGFSLERRAFLIPIHPNRHVIPIEVAEVVGAERRQLRETRRAEIRSFVLEEDHAPRRARFASDPAYMAAALAFSVREPGSEVRPGVGTPRSLLVRFSQRFGRDVDAIALLAALSRAVGLWDPSAAGTVTPPGSLCLSELTQLLFTTWRRGGAWDEARAEREVLRVAEGSRDPSPISALREMVIDALQDLGEGRWVPWAALEGYLGADSRIPGIERLLRRWAERSSIEAPSVLEITRRIALETLPTLGIIDLGGSAEEIAATVDNAPDGLDTPLPLTGVTLRLTPRGRALLAGAAPAVDETGAKFVDTHALRVGPSTKVAHILALAAFAELGRVGDQLDLMLTAPSIARALSIGIEGDALRTRIEAVAALPDTISRMLTQVSAVVGRATFSLASGFLWIEDTEIRELLRTRRPAAELFVDPSPPAGLLVAPDVDMDRLVRRCRSLGIEVESDGNVLRARSSYPAPARSSYPAPARSSYPAPRASYPAIPMGTKPPESGTTRPSSATIKARSKTPFPTKR